MARSLQFSTKIIGGKNMNAELLKAGFILSATMGFLLFNFSSKRNFKRIYKLLFKPREKNLLS